MARYYFDSCIWRDHYENRFGPRGRPLGKYATALFNRIIKKQDTLLFSDLNIRELKLAYTDEDINDMMRLLSMMSILKHVETKREDNIKAEKVAKERNLPPGDALHAILARNNNAIMVSQDKHYQKLKDIADIKRPEELI